MSAHPYRGLPQKAFWRKSVAGINPNAVDPVGRFMLRIDPSTKVATAGSCFAQHIARHLKRSGFNHYVSETTHPLISEAVASANNYGVFSARYGNIYTARQLLQLMQRALGLFSPIDDCWQDKHGNIADPFRPTIQPGGFRSESEMRADRSQHLAAVKQMFENLDVFVFTLGLTEGWISTADGAAYPLCPGVEAGIFDSEKYMFCNHTVAEVIADLSDFLSHLNELNPAAQMILTVSPVPLAATAVPDQHVLSATTYSKSVLRVAAGALDDAFPNVHYFPAYEIITCSASRGRYFADDLRNVTEEGVGHVMRCFLAHATNAANEYLVPERVEREEEDQFIARMNEFVEVICDEEKLGQ
jgi:hypothetical protein